jgi:hypothetical protein
MTVVTSYLLLCCLILCGVLFLVTSVCRLYVCLCVVLDTSRRDPFMGDDDQKMMTEGSWCEN